MKALIPLLNVSDAATSIRFYVDHLGFSIQKTFEVSGKVMWAHLSCRDIELMINISKARTTRRPRVNVHSYDDAVFYFQVDDVHQLHENLRRNGLNPEPVERQEYGLDEFTLRDPDGYELAFGSPVKP